VVTTSGYHGVVRAVGIKVLKAKLSEYVRLAKAGETILVTERDTVVAELRPAHRQPNTVPGLDEALDLLADRCEVTLRSADGQWRGPDSVRAIPEFSSQTILDALRED